MRLLLRDRRSTTTWPSERVTTTKSPPTTGRPLYVRSYGTYCSPLVPATTECWTKASDELACRRAGRLATRSFAD